MNNKFLVYFVFLTIFSCSSEKEFEQDKNIRSGNGTVWLSGGLWFCVTQIRMENGDTLVPLREQEILFYKSGQRINVTYIETESKEPECNIGKECKIIEYTVIE